MAGDKLVNVRADTAEDFLDAAHKAMKDRKKLGETSTDVEASFKFDKKTKKIVEGTLSLKMETKRVHFAGANKVKPDKANQDAIDQIESLNTDHEKNHRDSAQKAFDDAKDDLEKELVGKTEKEAKAVVQKMADKLTAACEKLHKSEGMITVTDDGKGTISVTEGPEGPGGCK